MRKTSCEDLIEVRPSPLHGQGAFARRQLRAGTVIGRYDGKRHSAAQVDRRDWNNHATYLFGLSDGSVIDGADGGNATRFLNHSCAPNCEAHEVVEPDGRLGIRLRTLTAVSAGDELLLDYALDIDEADRASDFPCQCGAPACRGSMAPAG